MHLAQTGQRIAALITCLFQPSQVRDTEKAEKRLIYKKNAHNIWTLEQNIYGKESGDL